MSSEREAVTRKVQLAGNSTYTVSLPKAWADDQEIEPGVEVTVWPFDQGVLVSHAPAGTYERRIDCTTLSPGATRTIVQELYVTGVDTIVLHADDGLSEATRRLVVKTAADLVGLSADQNMGASLRLTCALDPGRFPIERTVLQLQRVGLSMFDDATLVAVNDDPELAARVADRHPEVQRQARVVDRLFQRSLTDYRTLTALDVDGSRLFDYAVTARSLHRLAQTARILAELDTEPEADLSDEFEAHARDASRLLEDGVDILLASGGLQAAVQIVERADCLQTELFGLRGDVVGGDAGGEPVAMQAFAAVESAASISRRVGRQAVRAASRT